MSDEELTYCPSCGCAMVDYAKEADALRTRAEQTEAERDELRNDAAFMAFEIAKVRAVFRDGADDGPDGWEPGETAVDALIRRVHRVEAERNLEAKLKDEALYQAELEAARATKAEAERDEAWETNTRFHRRVQEMEKWFRAALHVGLDTCDNLRRSASTAWASHARWKKEYRDAVERLVEAKVPDHVDGYGPMWRMGRLDVLIERLIAQRDKLRDEATRQGFKAKVMRGEPFTIINENSNLEHWYPKDDEEWESYTHALNTYSRDGLRASDALTTIEKAKGIVVEGVEQ